MNRIDKAFSDYKAAGRKAVVPFLSCGDPSLEDSKAIALDYCRAGATLLELGAPFSDPMADGPTIQAASQRSLDRGTTLTDVLKLAAEIRQEVETPLVLFTYYNLVINYGIEKLAADSATAGFDGWLIVDLPSEHANEIMPALKKHGLHRIPLVAPTTPEARLEKVLSNSGGFVYYISVAGITGARAAVADDIGSHLEKLRRHTTLPICVGFGVSSPETAQTAGKDAEGVIIGSKLISLIADSPNTETGRKLAVDLLTDIVTGLDPTS